MDAKICTTHVTYLPAVENGRVRQVKNVQSAGTSKWVLEHNKYGDPPTGWAPTGESFYGYIGQHFDSWEVIHNGDEMSFVTTTSGSPIFDHIVWRDGNWRAWAVTAPCGKGHWTKLVADPEKAEFKSGSFCDNGIFCPAASVSSP
jgi:hypothetical protein